MKEMSKSEIDAIISKVLQGIADEKEEAKLDEWLEANEKNIEIYQKLHIEWNRKKPPRKAVNEEELIDSIWSNQSNTLNISHSSRFKNLRSFILKSAAAILALVTFSFFYYLNQSNQNIQKDSYEVVHKENKGGQKSKIYLTDGSIIRLNSNSSLTYTRPFKDDIREVELEGEAYFEIVSDTLKPFVVKFGNSHVEVLGTAFNISAYSEDPKKVITLVKGKISLKHEDQSQTLTPGWIAEIIQNSNTIESYKGDISANLAWTRDELRFNNASYGEIFPVLERWYGMEIIVVGKYDVQPLFTGTFKDEYLNNVLENLITDENMRYEIDKEKVIVTFK
jgi:ferric-dicitrate binding protein FerR (iron transport regulator)